MGICLICYLFGVGVQLLFGRCPNEIIYNGASQIQILLNANRHLLNNSCIRPATNFVHEYLSWPGLFYSSGVPALHSDKSGVSGGKELFEGNHHLDLLRKASNKCFSGLKLLFHL
jgi:hypothetical protein